MVFDAFERFAPAHPDAVLVVIGLPEMYRARIAALPEAIRARVLDRPFVHGDAALRESYSALDCFLHAKQIGESFGYVLIESMLCECPVISLSTPEYLPVLLEDETGKKLVGFAFVMGVAGIFWIRRVIRIEV